MSARYAIGVGAARGVDADELIALVTRVVDDARIDLRDCVLCTIETKRDDDGFVRAATLLGTDLLLLSLAVLRERDADVVTRSARVEEMLGIGSVAEAAALVGAGQASTLLLPRAASARITCAIAKVSAKDVS